MRKTTLCLIAVYLLIATPIMAQSPTSPTKSESTPEILPTAVPSKQTEKIQELKDRIATKVAELKLLKKKVMVGEISNLNSPSFTLTTAEGERKVETNEDTNITQAIDNKTKTMKFSELKKGKKVYVWGNYLKEADVLTAKAIFIKEIPSGLLGTISDVDIKAGTVTLQNPTTNQSYLLDVEVFTKINSLDKDNKITKFGFSKIKTGSRSYIYATQSSQKDAAPYTAYRILILPNPPFTVITPQLKLDATVTP